jgi:hypothetical protein
MFGEQRRLKKERDGEIFLSIFLEEEDHLMKIGFLVLFPCSETSQSAVQTTFYLEIRTKMKYKVRM